MKSLVRMCVGTAVVMFAVGLLGACGSETDNTREAGPLGGVRDPSPFVRIKLKNTSPSRPATAQATPMSKGAPRQPLSVGPVAPGQELASSPNGTESSDSVTLTVTFLGAGDPVILHGSGSFPGKDIIQVVMQANESSGTATVTFGPGQGTDTIQLAP